ncbi:MAG: TauD/TfdA family dioxygenase [Actinomycetota bacterium]
MALDITPSGRPLGATVRGVDLTQPLAPADVAAIRAAWLDHKVLAFPDQAMTDTDLENYTLNFGPFGYDPYFQSIDGHPNIAAIHRTAAETSSLFADNWHADWTFQEFPPDGTCLHARIIPPVGGNTEFCNQQAVYEALPDDLRAWADEAVAIHSARIPYAPDGTYGEDDDDSRSMKIVTDESAYATQTHRLVREHPETGARTLYSCIGYIIGVEGMDDDEARDKLVEIYEWQAKPEFHYSHQWEPNMLTMWDNRCVLHRVAGGFEGHERLLHRTTIGYNADVRAA